jgi:signal recognition particle receptor subunit beta
MAEFGREDTEVKARIVYWGIEGSGKSTNAQVIHSKLRPDHRGELRTVPTRIDPTVTYDALPIELGQVGDVRTRIQILTVPGAPEHAPSRKQLLDEVDGIVFVVDTQRDRIDENIASLEELRSALASYGRSLEEIPLVVQYNKRDQSDPYALEELHRKLGMQSVAAFEAVATSGTGVLQTLTTISKRVIRHLRRRSATDPVPVAEPAPVAEAAPVAETAPVELTEPTPPPGTSQILETAAVALDPPTTSLDPSATSLDAPDDWDDENLDASAALDPALVYDEDHPDEEAIEAMATEAEAAFEPSFQQVTVELEPAVAQDSEPNAPAEMEAIHIESIGEARQTASGAMQIPILLRDEAGRSLAISLRVEIEASKTEIGD